MRDLEIAPRNLQTGQLHKLRATPTSSKIDPTLAVMSRTLLYAFDIVGEFKRTTACKQNCFYSRRGGRHISPLFER